MRNQLSANWLRLRKNWLTWLFLLAAVLLTLANEQLNYNSDLSWAAELNMEFSVENLFEGSFDNFVAVIVILFMSPALAGWCSGFFSKRSSNLPLVTGHSRSAVYLSNLLTVLIVATAMALPCFLLHGGLCLLHGAALPGNAAVQYLLLLLSVWNWAALVTMLTMLLKRGFALALSVILPVGMFIMSETMLKRLEYDANTMGWSGKLPLMAKHLIILLPQGQSWALRPYGTPQTIYECFGLPVWWLAIGAVVTGLLSTAVGLFFFRRKDLR